MKNLILWLALLLPCTAKAVLIDFDMLPGGGTIDSGTAIGAQYSSLGVTFSALENGEVVAGPYALAFGAALASGTRHSGNALFSCLAPLCGGGTLDDGIYPDIIRIEFAAPVNGVSWFTDPEGPLSIVFNAYDASDALLESVTASATLPNFVLTAFSASGISRIDALQPNENWIWALDNLSFTPAAVPVPGTLTLLVLALAGLGFGRRLRLS